MKRGLFSFLLLINVLTSIAQGLDSSVVIESKPYKNAVGVVPGIHTDLGMGYRYFPIKQIGFQGDYELSMFDNGSYNSLTNGVGLSFLYAPYRGRRMNYYIIEKNYIAYSDGFEDVAVGLGAMAEVRIRDSVTYSLLIAFLYDFQDEKLIGGLLGPSIMYNF